ncbi:DUF6688 family protein [Pedobacter sp. D749]|uniref:DUF6688 domain-containing protein n=1 Tax=Pedobacter sp. D749 TaxID=2856523 RepID=UPI0021052E5C|nr:DUF6688 family protein [Pedobacter sp. D749]
MIILAILLFILIAGVTILIFRKFKKIIRPAGLGLMIAYVFSICAFCIGLMTHQADYFTAIDPVDGMCYIPFGEKHILSLACYCFAFHGALILIWLKGTRLPPLATVLALSFIITGIVINVLILMQISEHNTKSIDWYDRSDHILLFLFTPILGIVIAGLTILHVLRKDAVAARERVYANAFLNRVNLYLARKSNLPLWGLILLIPVMLVTTVLLLILGQDADSMVKVFTDTTTWRFSRQMHPPVLDHKGHYLCTVAVSGSPKLVKPLRLGVRGGRTIVVNRQLLIANAFEEMIQDFSPRMHRVIRRNYDRYGYNLSKKINNEGLSNLTYVLMKPLEWIFLICLYLFTEKPELRISRQYSMQKGQATT